DTATTEIYTLSLHDALPICFRKIHLARYVTHPFFLRSERKHEDGGRIARKRFRGESIDLNYPCGLNCSCGHEIHYEPVREVRMEKYVRGRIVSTVIRSPRKR